VSWNFFPWKRSVLEIKKKELINKKPLEINEKQYSHSNKVHFLSLMKLKERGRGEGTHEERANERVKNGITNKTRMRTNWGYRNEEPVDEGQTIKIQAQKVKTIDWDKIAFTYPPVFLGDCKPSWSEKIHHVSQLEAAINGVKHKTKKSGRRVGVPATCCRKYLISSSDDRVRETRARNIRGTRDEFSVPAYSRPFPSPPLSLFQSQSKCEIFLW